MKKGNPNKGDNPSSGGKPSSPQEPSGFAATLAVLRVKNFRILEMGMVLSMAAMQMNIISRTWLAYHISGSAAALGLVAMARGLPQLVISPLAGAAADRFDKRKLLMATQCSLAFLSLINAALVHLDVIEIWHLVVLSLAQGLVFPFTIPSRQAMIPQFAGESKLAQAFALDSAGRNLNQVVAPSIGGLLIAWHPVVAFYAIAVAYAGSAVTIFQLPKIVMKRVTGASLGRDMVEGIRYISRNRILVVLLGIGLIAAFLGRPIHQFLTVFQLEVLHVSPRELGLMYTAIGIGALIGSVIIAGLSSSPRRGALQMGFGIMFGVSVVGFAICKVLTLSLIALFILGLCMEGYMTFNRVEVVAHSDEKYLGRVIGIYVMTWAMMPISALPLGYFIDRLGPAATFAGAGGTMALALALVMVLFPAVWHVRQTEEPRRRPHEAIQKAPDAG